MSLTKQKELIEDLRNSFSEWRKDAGFKATFENLEKIFFSDHILVASFVSPQINRMIC
jgi:hypothetical protein